MLREVNRFTADGKGELTTWNQHIRTATTDAPTREKLNELGLDYVADQLA